MTDSVAQWRALLVRCLAAGAVLTAVRLPVSAYYGPVTVVVL